MAPSIDAAITRLREQKGQLPAASKSGGNGVPAAPSAVAAAASGAGAAAEALGLVGRAAGGAQLSPDRFSLGIIANGKRVAMGESSCLVLRTTPGGVPQSLASSDAAYELRCASQILGSVELLMLPVSCETSALGVCAVDAGFDRLSRLW